jgi:DNA-binding XRE family transcriptional regulator
MKYTNDSKRIAANIRAERSRAKLSQEEVAAKLGLTRKTYIKYEVDASKIKTGTLVKLADMFGCNINAFYLP